jgi:hypothetical protein
MIHASFSSPQLLSRLGCEDAAPAKNVDGVVAKLGTQVQRVSARAAQATTGPGDTGQGLTVSPLNAQTHEQSGPKEMPSDPVRDQEMLDRTRKALAQIERDTKIYAEDLATQERRLAMARHQFATVGSAEDWGWVGIWQENVQQTREGYEGMQVLLVEARARYARLLASLEAVPHSQPHGRGE